MSATYSKAGDNSLLTELKGRAKIGLFMVLAWQLSLVLFPKINNGALMMLVSSLVEIVSMVIVFRFSGGRNIANDINEFNCYALIMHLLEIPLFYYTTISSDYHNNGVTVLLILALARLMYFGQKTEQGDYSGLPTFGILGYGRKKFAQLEKMPFKYWTDILFFGSALPLWFIIYKTNDQSVAITIVGVMLFIYFISDVMKMQAASAAQADLSPDASLLLKLFDDKSVAEKAQIMKLVASNFTAAPPDAGFSTTANSPHTTHSTPQALDAAAATDSDMALLNFESIQLCKIFNARSTEARDLILKFATTDFNLKDHDDFFETKQATDEAMRLIAQFRDEKHPSLTYQEILVGATFKKLSVEKQRYVLFDAQILRTLEHQKIREEIAEKDAKRERRAKFMKWKFYSGKLAPQHPNSGKEVD